ncbi:uncharacterized protein LOC130690328 [Daphnia carinata]|uniref:uncharacterized protein LOC130690328 n=1 Tax=Daphnia carinata TaxID=120202 RepID=UPI00257DBAE7|nr:uncharacterized protein LOC130690328 [Daphnia carinata]
MKLALIFLSVFLVAFSDQQFQQRRERLWWTPYNYAQQPFVNSYLPSYYNVQDDVPDYRVFRPTKTVTYSQNDELDASLVAAQYQDYFDEEENSDVQSRFNEFRERRPAFVKRPQNDERLLLSYLTYFKTTTASFTLTSSVTLTSVQSCIAAAKFKDDAAKTTACRRKRDLLDDSPSPADLQFAIVPSETQQVIPTVVPSLDVSRQHRQMSSDEALQHDIASSKGLGSSADLSGSVSWLKQMRDPRFLNTYSLASTTVTSYKFASTTVTKTVPIAADGLVLCLPTGYVVC